MIYTIGYQALKPERLRQIADSLSATIIDVHSKPVSRKADLMAPDEVRDLVPEHLLSIPAT
jgi:hypothetical protein